jgi:hypothetical protein
MNANGANDTNCVLYTYLEGCCFVRRLLFLAIPEVWV